LRQSNNSSLHKPTILAQPPHAYLFGRGAASCALWSAAARCRFRSTQQAPQLLQPLARNRDQTARPPETARLARDCRSFYYSANFQIKRGRMTAIGEVRREILLEDRRSHFRGRLVTANPRRHWANRKWSNHLKPATSLNCIASFPFE